MSKNIVNYEPKAVLHLSRTEFSVCIDQNYFQMRLLGHAAEHNEPFSSCDISNLPRIVLYLYWFHSWQLEVLETLKKTIWILRRAYRRNNLCLVLSYCYQCKENYKKNRKTRKFSSPQTVFHRPENNVMSSTKERVDNYAKNCSQSN